MISRHLQQRVITKKLREFINDERGNTESALVLVPLVFLFLCAMQLVATVFLRNESMIEIQNQASVRAISGDLLPSDKTIALASGERFQALQLLVTRDERDLPILIPALGSVLNKAMKITQSGIAVMEIPK